MLYRFAFSNIRLRSESICSTLSYSPLFIFALDANRTLVVVNGFPLGLSLLLVSVSLCCPLQFNQTGSIGIIPDLLQADGLFDLLIVVGILPAGRELLEGIREDLALAVPGATNSLEQLEDRVVCVQVRTFSFRLAFFKGHGAWTDKCDIRFLPTRTQDDGSLPPKASFLTRHDRIVFTLRTIMKGHADTRQPIALTGPPIPKWRRK